MFQIGVCAFAFGKRIMEPAIDNVRSVAIISAVILFMFIFIFFFSLAHHLSPDNL